MMKTTIYEKINQDIQKNVSPAKFEEIKKANRKETLIFATKLKKTLYDPFIINPDKSLGLTDTEIISITNKARNALKKYPYVTLFIAESTTDEKSARRVKKKINGRYRTIVEGRKVPPHLHIGVIGYGARSYVEYLRVRLKKGGIQSKYKAKDKGSHEINYINYCYRQADKFHQYGHKGFDFRKYIYDDVVII